MQLQNKRGTLTAYGLACGYVEKRGEATLHREHGLYHVRGWVPGMHGGSVRAWQVFERLVNARKALARMARTATEGSAS